LSRTIKNLVKGATSPDWLHDSHMTQLDQRFACDQVVQATLMLTGKWRLAIVCALGLGAVRSGDLRRLLPAASKKVILENLTEMENLGLVIRRERAGWPRHVEYELAEAIREDAVKLVENLLRLADRVSISGMKPALRGSRASELTVLSTQEGVDKTEVL